MQASVSQPADHTAVFEWATELGQKYVRMQLLRHQITTAWEHIDFVQQQVAH